MEEPAVEVDTSELQGPGREMAEAAFAAVADTYCLVPVQTSVVFEAEKMTLEGRNLEWQQEQEGVGGSHAAPDLRVVDGRFACYSCHCLETSVHWMEEGVAV